MKFKIFENVGLVMNFILAMLKVIAGCNFIDTNINMNNFYVS